MHNRGLLIVISGPSGAGKRRTVSALERALLLGAGCSAGHPLRPAEPGAEGPAPLLQCHRAGGQGGIRALLHPEVCL